MPISSPDNLAPDTARLSGLTTLYRTDQSLKPHEVSALLGIDIEVNEVHVEVRQKKAPGLIHNIIVIIFAVLLGLGGLVYAMYDAQAGIFHPTVALLPTR
mgnify:CR=1 FL=1